MLLDKFLEMGVAVQDLDLLLTEAAAFFAAYKSCVIAEGAFGAYREIVVGIAVGDEKLLFLLCDPVKFRAHKNGRIRMIIPFFSQS